MFGTIYLFGAASVSPREPPHPVSATSVSLAKSEKKPDTARRWTHSLPVLRISLAARVGSGNRRRRAGDNRWRGPGAVFWMWIAAIIAWPAALRSARLPSSTKSAMTKVSFAAAQRGICLEGWNARGRALLAPPAGGLWVNSIPSS